MKKYRFKGKDRLSVHNKLMGAVKQESKWIVEKDKIAETVLGWISGTSKALEVKIQIRNWKSRKNSEMTVEKVTWLFFLPYFVIGSLVAILMFVGYALNLFESIFYIILFAFEIFLVIWCAFQYYRTSKNIESFFSSLAREISAT